LNSELDKLTKEKEEFERKYETLDRQREDLLEQVKKLKTEKAAAPVAEQALAKSQAEDTYWAGIFKAKTDMEIQLEALRGELKTVQISNEQVQREKAALELEVANFRREEQDYKRQVDYNQKLIGSLSQELVREKNDKFQIQESSRAIKSENTTLRRQLSSLTNRKMSLERKLAELEEKNKSLDKRFGEMDVLLKEKMSQIDNLKSQLYGKQSAEAAATAIPERESSVELPPIVVRPKQEAARDEPVIALIGKVLALNKDNNFVIVDLGEDSGVRLGDAFKIYRDARLIAEVEVIQCRKSISACDIKKEYAPVKIGDIVK
jgi:chromosome segregation ATPase